MFNVECLPVFHSTGNVFRLDIRRAQGHAYHERSKVLIGQPAGSTKGTLHETRPFEANRG
jgi:hypothetical protein